MASTMKTAMAGTRITSKTPAPSVSRAVPVVRASAAENRRTVLGGLVASVGLVAARSAQAVSSIVFEDSTKVGATTGYNLIYEARDDDLPQSTRDGFDQARGDIEATKARVSEASKRLSTIKGNIEKAEWTEGRNQLRLQLGTLSFDLNTLSGTPEAKAAKAALIEKLNALDYALGEKSGDKALAAFAEAEAAFAAVS